MNELDKLLKREEEKLLSNNSDKLSDFIKQKKAEILDYLSHIGEENEYDKELRELGLSKTGMLILMIRSLQKEIQVGENNIIFPISFSNGVDYSFLMDDLGFIEIDVSVLSEGTMNLFVKKLKSTIQEGIFLIQHEAFEHEDDTDKACYYILINNS